MKKIVALILSIVMMLGLVACGSTENNETSQNGQEQTEITNVAKYEGTVLELLEATVVGDDYGRYYVQVKANFTNENEDDTYALSSFGVFAFQDSVELENVSDINGTEETLVKSVKDGASIEVQYLFSIEKSGTVEIVVKAPTADEIVVGKQTYEVEVPTEQELTADEKLERAKILMAEADLDGALLLLKEIENEITDAEALISLCEKYIPYAGIWESDNYVYDSSEREPDAPVYKSYIVEIMIDGDTLNVSANIGRVELSETEDETKGITKGARINYYEENYGYVVNDTTAVKVHDNPNSKYIIESSFDLTTGEFKSVTYPKPENTAMTDKSVYTGTFTKSDKNIDDYIFGGVMLDIALFNPPNPCEVLDNCLFYGASTGNFDGSEKYKFSYRVSINNEQYAQEQYDQYIAESITWIESRYQYDIEDNKVSIWKDSQNPSVDAEYATIALEEYDTSYCVKVEVAHEVEISANDPVAPRIGMTKAQVLDSTWGEPDYKNITEHSYGVHEQWVYEGEGYIYFDDGIVSAIQYKDNK